ncbi:hypothetical protein QL285_017438 [Trifolium repens]|jgi:hypothetical protein|nr:hypothetical protein QL285_017438 [Trifolium repens]
MDPQQKKKGVNMHIDDFLDEILVKILELLPLKDAVVTSVWSKIKWKNTWKQMFSIDISIPPYPGEDVFESILIRREESLQGFDAGITVILVKHEPLKTLRIYIAFDDADIENVGALYIRNWMERVINRGVEIVYA